MAVHSHLDYYPENYVPKKSPVLPGNKRLTTKRSNVGTPSAWKEFGANPDDAVAVLDKKIQKLRTEQARYNKKGMKGENLSQIAGELLVLFGLKKQAKQAVCYVNYDSELILPNVKGPLSNPEYNAGAFG